MSNEPDSRRAYGSAPQFYANNSVFELSAWDLKIAFAQLDQGGGEPTADWKAVVTIPWAQAKVFAYYLQLNLALFESDNGQIPVPRSVLPQNLVELAGEKAQLPPSLVRFEADLRERLFGPEASRE